MHVRGIRHMRSLQQIESRPKRLRGGATVTGQAGQTLSDWLQTAARFARLEHERARLVSEMKTRAGVQDELRARLMYVNEELGAVRLILDRVPVEEAEGPAQREDEPGSDKAYATMSLEY